MEIIDKTISLAKPQAILFDWDNTLVDAWSLIYKATHNTFVKYGKKPWSFEETKINVHRSLKEIMPILFPTNYEEAGKFYKNSYAELMHEIRPLPHAVEALEMLNEQNIKCAIISNKTVDYVFQEAETLKISHLFSSIMGSGSIDVDKPNPKTVYETLKRINIANTEKVWFVGDSVSDMEVAYASGSLPIFYGPEDFRNDRYKNCAPKLHISDYNDFINFMARYND